MNRRELFERSIGAVVAGSLAFSRLAATEEETIYVSVETGTDSNAGTRQSPLKTLAAAVKYVNQSTGTGPATILVAEGIYALDQTVFIRPGRQFTRT